MNLSYVGKERKRVRVSTNNDDSQHPSAGLDREIERRVLAIPAVCKEQVAVATAVRHDADVEEENDLVDADDDQNLSDSNLLVSEEDFGEEEGEGDYPNEGEGDCRAYWENRIIEDPDEEAFEESDSYHGESDDPDQSSDSHRVTYNVYSQSDVEDDRGSQSSENRPAFTTIGLEESDDDDFADLEQMLMNRRRT